MTWDVIILAAATYAQIADTYVLTPAERRRARRAFAAAEAAYLKAYGTMGVTR